MIEEESRTYRAAVSDTVEDEKTNIIIEDKTDLIQQATSFNEKLPQESELKVSRFFIELFICSILLWSLLFMKQSSYNEQIGITINRMINQEIQTEWVQNLIKELEVAVKQIL
ncbi:MAG: hypothetical protein E7231_06325 [Cellulosilyticum sp.]|nr:hypothetical protein [Cellulosilyticum sp.]